MMNVVEVHARRSRNALVAAICVASVLFAGVKTAVAQATEANIIGQVTDESGAVLPGVTINATSPALQVPVVSTVTNERGEYRISPLPIGTYEVNYELAGFQTARHESIRLTVGFTARLDVVLKVGSLNETVTVSGQSPVVDVASAAASTQFTRETLELTVSSRNGLTSLLAQTPGVRTTLDVGGSANTEQPVFRAFGQAGEPWSILEGVATSTMQGTGGNGQYFDYNSYDEARVSTIANDAETPTRGLSINAVVKSGSNEFHGSGFFGRHILGVQADNIDDALRAQGIGRGNPIVKRYDVSADLGGRVLYNKLWFYGGVRQRNNVHEIPNCFVTNSIDLPDGSPCLKAQPIWFHTQKLSGQLNQSHRLILFHQWTRKWDMDGASEFIAWESRNNDVTYPETLKAEWQGVLSDKLVASLQWGGYQFIGRYYSNDKGPYIDREPGTGTIGVSTRDIFTQIERGENLGVGQRVFERHFHTKGGLSSYRPDLFHGNHDLKVGFDYLNATNSRAQQLRATGPAYQLIFNNGVPFQIAARNAPNMPHQAVNYLGVYAKDTWTVARRLTLNLGLRYAHDDGFIPGSCYEASLFFPAECYDKRQFNVWSSIAPRLHATLDLSGDGRTVIKGGYGRFDHMRQLSELQSADPNSTTTRTFLWTDPNGNRRYDAGEVNLDPNGPAFVSQSGGSNTVANPDERQPKSDEYSVSFERQLMENLGFRVTGIYSKYIDAYRTVNALRPPSAYSVAISRPDPGDPTNIITYYEFPRALAGRNFERFMLTNTDENPTYGSFEVAASKRLSSRWMLMVSYSATKANVPFVNGLNPSQSASSVYLAALDPNAEIFAEDRSWESVGKISGAYVLPAEVTVSTNYEYRSGQPWARQVLFTGGATIPSIVLRVEPIGTRRLPSISLVNMRVQKSFAVTQGRKLEVRANIYNLTNANTILSVNMRNGSTFQRPTSILEPRILELSASFTF